MNAPDEHEQPAPIAATWLQMVKFGLVGPWLGAAVACILLLSLVPGLIVAFMPDLADALDVAAENLPDDVVLREVALLACGGVIATAWYRRLLLGASRFGIHPLRLMIVLVPFFALYYGFWALEVGAWAGHALAAGGGDVAAAWATGLAMVEATSRLDFNAGAFDPVAAATVLARYALFTLLTSWLLMIVASEAIGEAAGPRRAWRLTKARKTALGAAIALAGLPPAILEPALRADAAASGPAAEFAFAAAADFCLLLWIANATFIVALEFARATGRPLRA